MKKFWQVFSYEYTRQVMRKGFIFGLLSVPAIIALMALVIILLLNSENNPLPIGYVDYSGLLANPVPGPLPDPPERPIEMVAFVQESQAEAALRAGEIQAYFVLEVDYRQTSQARVVTLKRLNDFAQGQFQDFVRANLLAGQPAAVAARLTQGDNLIIRSVDGNREMGASEWLNILVPLFTGVMFMIAIFSSSGYLMQAVVEEKENRTMEMLLTSVSPTQLMSGKTLAMISVGMTQILAWLIMAAAVIWAGREQFTIFKTIRIYPETLGLVLLVFLPSIVTVSALMVIIGATVADAREGQSYTGLITIPVVLPYLFAMQIMTNPNSPLAIALSFFPLSAPIAITLRVAFASIPAWQLSLNLLALVGFAIAALWMAGRAFRLGMLRYGQALPWRQLFSRQKGAAS